MIVTTPDGHTRGLCMNMQCDNHFDSREDSPLVWGLCLSCSRVRLMVDGKVWLGVDAVAGLSRTEVRQ